MATYEQDRKVNDEHIDVKTDDNITDNVTGMTSNQLLQAYNAAVTEHELNIKASARAGKRALMWMTVIGLVSIVDRLNEVLLFGFQALPSFQLEFGVPVRTTDSTLAYTLTASQQELLSNLPGAGHIIGLAIFGLVVDKLGNRYSLMGALALNVILTLLPFFATNFGMVLAGTTINNAVVAFVSAVAPAWCLELAPLALRPYSLIYMTFVQGIASLLAQVMCQAYSTSLSRWAWRIPYAIQWGFPLPLIIGIYFAPESPWWLVRHAKPAAALKSLARLHNGENDDDQMLALIEHTVQLERALNVGGSYLDCFKGTNLRRTEVAFMSSMSQNISGFALAGGAYFFQTAGLSASDSFALTCGQAGLSLLASLSTAVFIKRLGRRGLWMGGTAGMAVTLAIVGALALVPNQAPAVIWPQGAFMLVWSFLNTVSVGALAGILTTEIGAVSLRRKTQAIGLLGYDVSALVSGAISPYLLNPNNANLKGKAAWIPCGFNIVFFLYGYFRVPEVQGRNSEEIDILFERKVPARQFKSYVINRVEEFGLKPVSDDVPTIREVPAQPIATLV